MAESLKVLTLNCWGIPFPYMAKLKNERLAAIADELSKGTHDLIILEEVWAKSDYDRLCEKVSPMLPYSHYFESGWIGSGMCVFSKGPITESFMHCFFLNGFAHKVHHGDWYAAKGVGLCKIQYKSLSINVYVTHVHAQYDFTSEEDEYNAHRTCQAFELSQFIRYTSESCDLVIVGGDLNLQSHDLGYKIVRNNANLLDAWLERKTKTEGELGVTVDSPENSFTVCDPKSKHPEGQRIDFIFYRCNAGIDVTCENSYVTMGRIPDKTFNFSDHEGLAAEFSIRQYPTAMGSQNEINNKVDLLEQAVVTLDRAISKVRSSQKFYGTLFTLCVLAMLGTGFWMPIGLLAYPVMIGRILFSMLIGYLLIMFVVICSMEKKGLSGIRNDIVNVIAAEKMKEKSK